MKVFIDTWGWLVLADKKEKYHNTVKKYFKSAVKKKYQIFTSDYVIDETITLIFRCLKSSNAVFALDRIINLLQPGYISLINISGNRFEKALALRKKFLDKPLISFTDLTSIIIMLELGIKEILTEDEHFLQVGFSFIKIPKSK